MLKPRFIGNPFPLRPRPHHPEASRLQRSPDRAQDGHGEQEELLRGADQAGEGRTSGTAGGSKGGRFFKKFFLSL